MGASHGYSDGVLIPMSNPLGPTASFPWLRHVLCPGLSNTMRRLYADMNFLPWASIDPLTKEATKEKSAGCRGSATPS